MTKLRETQQLLWRLISAPDGVKPALAALADRARRLPDGLDGVVRGDDRLGAVERVEIYANMYFFRLLECLAEDFPALHAVVGHERFHELTRDYLTAYPSEGPSVRMLGRRLGEFLEGHRLAAEWPWLADLARFEWALLDAFDAPDAAPVGENRLRALGAEDWPLLRLTLAPSLQVLEARAPVQEVWSAATEGRELRAVSEAPTPLRVWREDLRVFHRAIDAVELAALRAVGRGETFAGLCEAAAAIVGEKSAAERVVALLQRWIADALIVDLGTATRS